MITKGIKFIITLSLVFGLMYQSEAQTTPLTLETCYRLAKENYPALKKMDLVAKTADLTIRNANKKYLPQFNINGQATYQSQVVDYGELLGSNAPALGADMPEFSRDQYRIQGEIEQLLFDGGNTRFQKKISKANAGLQKQNVEVELYAINDRINSIFFSIFLLDAQLELNNLKIATMQTQLKKTEAAYTYGTAYLSDVNEIKAEIENTKSRNIDYAGNRSAFLKILSLFIGKEVNSSADLVKPDPPMYSGEINRPELKIYDLQKDIYDAQKGKLQSSYLPKINAFFQGAYGRPTLNPISDEFGPWYVTGLRLNWSLGSLYTVKNQREIYNLNSQVTDVDKEAFVLNVKMDIVQQQEHIQKYTEMIAQDKKTIELRETVTQSAVAKLANGVITTYEYIQKVNNENAAKQSLILHQTQLLQAQYNLKFKSGN